MLELKDVKKSFDGVTVLENRRGKRPDSSAGAGGAFK